VVFSCLFLIFIISTVTDWKHGEKRRGGQEWMQQQQQQQQ
jgi:hypothetical protein